VRAVSAHSSDCLELDDDESNTSAAIVRTALLSSGAR